MAESAGWSYWDLVPRFRQGGFKDALKNAEPEIARQATEVGRRTGDKMSLSLGKAFKTGSKVAVGGVAALAGTALFKGFGRLKSIDEARAKLVGLGHDAKGVQAIMDNALTSVKGTAFGLDEAATVAASAVASGVKPGKELTRTLKLVGDAATIGGSSLSDMGLIFNKVAATGKIQGEVLAQLGERGIPVLQLLGKELGKTPAQVAELASQGKIGFETFQRAMENGLGGAALKSGETFTGSLKNLNAALGRIGANVLSGIFPELTKGMGDATQVMGQLEPKAQELGKTIGDIARDAGPVAVDVFEALGTSFKVAKEFGEPLVPIVKGIADGFGALPDGAQKVIVVGSAVLLLKRNLDITIPSLRSFGDESTRAAAKTFALRAGAGAAGIGLITLADNAGGATSDLGAMATVAGSLAVGFAAGGPFGAAIGGAAGLLSVFGQRSSEAAAAQAELDAQGKAVAATLNDQTGALTKNTREMIAKTFADNGAFTAAAKMGISLKDVTNAALGNKDALFNVNRGLQEYADGLEATGTKNVESVGPIAKLGQAIGVTTDEIERERKKIGQVGEALGKLDGKKANVKVTAETKAARAAIVAMFQFAESLPFIDVKGKGFAGGGYTGAGSKLQPAGIVHADEFVVRKEARRRAEASRPGALDRLNRTGKWPGYADGGRVGAGGATAADRPIYTDTGMLLGWMKQVAGGEMRLIWNTAAEDMRYA